VNGIQEVVGSIPSSSTRNRQKYRQVRLLLLGGFALLRDNCQIGVLAPEKQKPQGLFAVIFRINLEAAGGFEPPYNGFADRRLTTWLSRPLFVTYRKIVIRSMSRPERFPM
jgi:hypothetical protein